MTTPIRKVCVIGGGVMGSGIAAHLANAGVRVLLLDIVPPNLTDAEKLDKKHRDRFAQGGLEKAVKARPAAFFHASLAGLVRTGNVDDDLEQAKDCDLVIEAIIEKLEPKQSLFARLEKIVPEHAIVASNTSGLRIARMMEGRTDSFKKRFCVMHFFNPVRYMKLLELVAGPDTAPETIARIKRFGEDMLGKGIVVGKDTPNFVGNRIGAHSSSDDPSRYRSQDEVDTWIKRDPLLRLRRHLDHLGAWSDAKDEALEAEHNAEIGAAITEVEKHGPPARETIFDDVYATRPWHLEEQRAELLRHPPAKLEHG